jgi:hypothetical protein
MPKPHSARVAIIADISKFPMPNYDDILIFARAIDD